MKIFQRNTILFIAKSGFIYYCFCSKKVSHQQQNDRMRCCVPFAQSPIGIFRLIACNQILPHSQAMLQIATRRGVGAEGDLRLNFVITIIYPLCLLGCLQAAFSHPLDGHPKRPAMLKQLRGKLKPRLKAEKCCSNNKIEN